MIDISLFFPTAISIDTNELLAQQMLPIAKKYLNDVALLTDQLNYKSTYHADSGIEQYNDVKQFLEYINTVANEYLEKAGYDLSKISLTAKVFVSEMQYGDFHNTHVHPNCVLSGIMYLQVPEESAPIVFYDPRSAKNMSSLPIISETLINQRKIPIFPKSGMLLLWESWLMHSVPKNHSTDGRITIVFNFS
jgi:uncharacterized protein (TIGR02466 family)